MAAGVTQISAESPNISIGPEIDMSILERLENLDSQIPEDAVTARDVAKKMGWRLRVANQWLYEGFLEGKFSRARKTAGRGHSHPYYYWENNNE